MIDAPDEVLQKLSYSQKIAIVELFSEIVEKSGETLRSAGTRSSPGSSDSTAKASKAG
jgi:hypothetical protein